MINDSDFQNQLEQAPPNAPTQADADAASATQQSQQAQGMANTLADSRPTAPNAPPPVAPVAPQWSAPQGSFSDKLGQALHAAQKDPATPDLLAQPMGWAKMMLGATTQALTKAPGGWDTATSNSDATPRISAPVIPNRSLGQRLNASFGDLAAAQGPGGFLGGFSRTAAAQNTREQGEMIDRQNIAISNARMVHEQELNHKMGEDQIAAAASSGKEGMNAILNAEIPGVLVAEGKNSDEIKAMIQKGELDPTRQTVFLTGRTLTGRDESGQPLFRSTYSVVNPAGDVKMTDKQVSYVNDHLGMNLTEGQSLPAVQFNSLWQRAQSAEVTKAARDLALAKNGIEVRKAQVGADAEAIARNPIITNAINGHMTSPDDPYAVVKAYNTIVNNPKLLNDPSMPQNFPEVYATWAGHGDPKAFATMQEKYSEAQGKNKDATLQMLDDFEKKPEGIEGKTPAYAAAMNSIINDPKQTPEVKARAASALAIIKETEAHELQFDASKAGSKKQAEDEASVGDTSQLVDSALSYDLDPEKMFGIRGGQRAKFMSEVMTAAKDRNIPWNEGDYKARYQTKQDFKPEGKGGLQVQSLNTFAGHVGTAIDRIPALNNAASPQWNWAMNKIHVAVGDEQYGRMQTALEAVKDEYLNFLKNAHATTTQEQERAESILNPNMSPAQIHGVLAQMADTIGIRGGQLQRNYTTTMKKPYVGMLDPDSDKIMQSLGVNTDKMKGIPSQPQPHSSDLQRPQRFPTASGTKIGSDGNMYWMDLNHKPLGRLTPEESAIAERK